MKSIKFNEETGNAVLETDKGALKTFIYNAYTRTKIWNQLARLKFMLDFYLRNYKLNTTTNR